MDAAPHGSEANHSTRRRNGNQSGDRFAISRDEHILARFDRTQQLGQATPGIGDGDTHGNYQHSRKKVAIATANSVPESVLVTPQLSILSICGNRFGHVDKTLRRKSGDLWYICDLFGRRVQP
jgi:hypothetical protein